MVDSDKTRSNQYHDCAKGCGAKSNKKCCDSPTCTWYVCANCKIMWNPRKPKRYIPWTKGWDQVKTPPRRT